MSESVTVPALPTATQNAQAILAAMSALNGVLTDYNVGSIIRTISESLGYVIEEQGAELTAQAFQNIIYGAYSVYGIVPFSATFSSGNVTFLTSNNSNPPLASQNVVIPVGTVVQTAGGIQFQTVQPVTLLSGTTSATVGISALAPGSGSNVAASSIVQIANGLTYPLFVLNGAPTTGGNPSEAPAQTAARFAAAVSKPGLASPQAVANAAIGVTVTGTNEICLYSSVYESGITSGIAGFVLYVDNGTGAASSGLISSVTNVLNAGSGYRPVGVPYVVSAVTPVYADVGVSGTLYPQYEGTNATVASAIVAGVQSYFSLPFAATAYQGQIAAAAANAAPGQLSSLTVTLNTSASSVSAGPGQRVILQSINTSIL